MLSFKSQRTLFHAHQGEQGAQITVQSEVSQSSKGSFRRPTFGATAWDPKHLQVIPSVTTEASAKAVLLCWSPFLCHETGECAIILQLLGVYPPNAVIHLHLFLNFESLSSSGLPVLISTFLPAVLFFLSCLGFLVMPLLHQPLGLIFPCFLPCMQALLPHATKFPSVCQSVTHYSSCWFPAMASKLSPEAHKIMSPT